MQRAAALRIRPRVAAQRAQAEEMRAHFEDSAIAIVARLIESEMANKSPCIASMIL
jgi:hypothetical protein